MPRPRKISEETVIIKEEPVEPEDDCSGSDLEVEVTSSRRGTGARSSKPKGKTRRVVSSKSDVKKYKERGTRNKISVPSKTAKPVPAVVGGTRGQRAGPVPKSAKTAKSVGVGKKRRVTKRPVLLRKAKKVRKDELVKESSTDEGESSESEVAEVKTFLPRKALHSKPVGRMLEDSSSSEGEEDLDKDTKPQKVEDDNESLGEEEETDSSDSSDAEDLEESEEWDEEDYDSDAMEMHNLDHVQDDKGEATWVQPNYKDKEWFKKNCPSCQICKETFPLSRRAVKCFHKHKGKHLRCYLCFMVIRGGRNGTKRLFKHFQKRHETGDKARTVKCPYCEATVRYKSVSCHVVCTHFRESLGIPNGQQEGGNVGGDSSESEDTEEAEMEDLSEDDEEVWAMDSLMN